MTDSHDYVMTLSGGMGYADATLEIALTPLPVDGVGVRFRFAIPTRSILLQSGFSASQDDVLSFVTHIGQLKCDERMDAVLESGSDNAMLRIGCNPKDTDYVAIAAEVQLKYPDDLTARHSFDFHEFYVTKTYLNEIERFFGDFMRSYYGS